MTEPVDYRNSLTIKETEDFLEKLDEAFSSNDRAHRVLTVSRLFEGRGPRLQLHNGVMVSQLGDGHVRFQSEPKYPIELPF